jgi:iron complex transport system ATP-binding protein
MSRREIATLLGVVPQICTPTFPVSVELFFGMGRYARERFLGGGTADDARVVRACLEQLELSDLAQRPIFELSGGEFRRVLIAQALAQEPRIILFDEPVQQLDLLHQLEVMEFARSFTRRGGTAGVVVLHELGLAARYCDRIALLHLGRIMASGTPRDVLTPANLRVAYGVETVVRECPETQALEIIPIAPVGSVARGHGT